MVDKWLLIQNAKVLGIDLVGIAPIERFKGLPPEGDPLFIKPDTSSVIVLGHQIPRGFFRAKEHGSKWETGHSNAGLVDGNIRIEQVYELCCWLEEMGYEAVPLFQYPVEMRNQGVSVREGLPEPNVIVDAEYAAHAAGLGEFGSGKFFLTPEFGPRQHFSLILTDAEIEPDDLFKGSICDKCGECIKACPAHAYHMDETVTAKLCEGEAEWNKLRTGLCMRCRTGALKNEFAEGAEPYRIAAACGRACIAHLEDNSMLINTFKNKFRED